MAPTVTDTCPLFSVLLAATRHHGHVWAASAEHPVPEDLPVGVTSGTTQRHVLRRFPPAN